MPITINGDGTVTGISAGGLPDGSISTADIADDAVSSAKIADDAVTLAKLSTTGTPGAGNFLRGDNSWQEAGGGAWTLINSSVASNSASITITGLSTTYSTFSIHLQGMKSSASSRTLYMRIGNSSGIVSTGYNYDSHVQVLHENTPPNYYANISQNLASSNAGFQIGYASGWSNADGFLNAVLYLQRGSTTSDNNPMMHGTYSMHSSGTGDMAGGSCCYRYANALITDMDRLEFYNSSGDIALGRISVFGIAHA